MAMNVGAVVGEIVLRYDKATKALKAVQQQTKRSMGQMTKYVKDHREAISAMGRAMVVGGTAMAGGFALMTREAVKFDAAMRNVNTIARLTEKELKGVKDELKSLSMETGESVTVLASGLYDIYSAGLQGADALLVLAAASKAAIAGVSDTTTAAGALLTALASWKIEAKEVGRVSDVLFKTVELGRTTFQQLAGSLQMGASLAEEAGVSLEEFSAAIATATARTLQADQAGMAFMAMMTSLLSPSTELAKAILVINKRYTEFEFSSTRGMIAALGLGGTLVALKEHADLAGIGMEKLITETRALRMVLPLVTDEGKKFLDNIGKMEKSLGSTAAAFDEQSKAVDRQLKILKASIQVVAVSIGETLLPAITNLIAKMTPLIASWLAFIKANTELIRSFSMTLLKLSAISIALGALAIAITSPGGIVLAIAAISSMLILGIVYWDDYILALGKADLKVSETAAAFIGLGATIRAIGRMLGATVAGLARGIEHLAKANWALLTRNPREAANELRKLADESADTGAAFERIWADLVADLAVVEAAVVGSLAGGAKGADKLAEALVALQEMVEAAAAAASGAGPKVKDFTNRLEALFARIQDLNKELAELPKGTRIYAEALAELSEVQDEYNRALESSTGSIMDVYWAEVKLWQETVKLDYQFDLATKTVVDFTSSTDRAKAAVGGLLGMFQRFIAGSQAWSKSMAAARQQVEFFMKQTVALVSGVWPGFDQVEQIQKQIADLQMQLSKGLLSPEAVAATEERIEALRAALATLSDTVEVEVNEVDAVWEHAMTRIQDGFGATIGQLIRTGGQIKDWWEGVGDMFRTVFAEVISSLVSMWMRDFVQKIAKEQFGKDIFGTVAGAVGGAPEEGKEEGAVAGGMLGATPEWVTQLANTGALFLQASAVFNAASGNWRTAILQLVASIAIQKISAMLNVTAATTEAAAAGVQAASAIGQGAAATANAAAAGVSILASTYMGIAAGVMLKAAIINAGVKAVTLGLGGNAAGGIFTKPTIALVGEGSESEALLPLSQLSRLLASEGGGQGGTPINYTFSPQISVASLNELDLRQLQRRGFSALEHERWRQGLRTSFGPGV